MMRPQLMRTTMDMGARAICPRQPVVAGGCSRQHHRLVVVAALRAGVVAAQLLVVLSVQWASDGTQVASGVLTAMTFSSTSARMSVTANPTAILIIMRCVLGWPFLLTFRDCGPLTSLIQRFAPQCYHCKTAIVDERFITLDDPELGKRTYHEQHFFCSECGDPFLAPSIDRQVAQGPAGRGVTFKGDGEFENDDVGFTVYKGYPYCEACHVRLRSPKCKKCKDIIRDGQQAVEALGGKYHWQCFCCTVCFVFLGRSSLTWLTPRVLGLRETIRQSVFLLAG
jgi:hypothetical protein